MKRCSTIPDPTSTASPLSILKTQYLFSIQPITMDMVMMRIMREVTLGITNRSRVVWLKLMKRHAIMIRSRITKR